MRSYVKAWPDRVWAVEGANSAGRPLAQRLVEAAEQVVDRADSILLVSVDDEIFGGRGTLQHLGPAPRVG